MGRPLPSCNSQQQPSKTMASNPLEWMQCHGQPCILELRTPLPLQAHLTGSLMAPGAKLTAKDCS